MGGKLSTAQAAAEAGEVRSWTCRSCGTMVESEGRYCRSCADYWQDVRDGMFEDSPPPPEQAGE